MNIGNFYFTAFSCVNKCKKHKLFGLDGSNALKIINKFLKFIFITADNKGYKISKKIIFNDMKMSLLIISNIDKLKNFKQKI